MALFNRLTIRLIKATSIKNSSTAAQAIQIQEELSQSFRTKESNPVKHNVQHLNKYYRVPPKDIEFTYAQGLTRFHEKQIKTFAEFCILIRKPAIELLSYLTQTDYSKPVNKYVLYGEYGTGKTTTLYHALHYAYLTNKIIIHVTQPQLWFRYPKEASTSETQNDMVNLPLDAAAWLNTFKLQNLALLNEADIKLSKTYEWSSQEISPQDSPLINLINLGIERIKYSCDITLALMNELKVASRAGKCKVFVAIDGYNAFYASITNVKNDDKKYVPASKISLTKAFLEITKSDWCNGQIVLITDIKATKERRDSDLPRYLLSKEGFDHLDPFLPILHENYTQCEFDTVIDYYKNRKWIRHITSDGVKELKLLSGANPFKLMDCCKHL